MHGQRATDLVEAVYRATIRMPPEERFGLTLKCAVLLWQFLPTSLKDKGAEPTVNFSTSCRLRTDPCANSKLISCWQDGLGTFLRIL